MAMLCQKNHTLRLETLNENKEYVEKKGDVGSDESDEDVNDDDGDGDDSIEDFKKTKQNLEKYGGKLQAGKALTEEEMKDLAIGGFGDDDSDSDYDYNGGDMGLYYDSRLEEVDEFKYVRDGLLELQNVNANQYGQMMTAF